MQQGLKINPHGVVGIAFLFLMFGIAFFLNWNVNWWYFSASLILYSVAILFLTSIVEDPSPLSFRWFLGCHLALFFFAVGLLVPGPGEWLLLSQGIFWGPAISFLLLRTSGDKSALYLHWLVALLLIILMAGVAFLYGYVGKHVGAVYFGCVLVATLAYVVTIIVMKLGFSSGRKLQLGCHLAFILLIVGFMLPLKDTGSGIAFFIAGIAVGLAIPHLLLR